MHTESNDQPRRSVSPAGGGFLGGVIGAAAGVIVIMAAWAGSSGGRGTSVGPLFHWLFVEICFFIFGICVGLFAATFSSRGRQGIGVIVGFGAGLIVVYLTNRIVGANHVSESEGADFRQFGCIACLMCVGSGMFLSTVRPRWIWTAITIYLLGIPALAWAVHSSLQQTSGWTPPERILDNIKTEKITIRLDTTNKDRNFLRFDNQFVGDTWVYLGTDGPVFSKSSHPESSNLTLTWTAPRTFEMVLGHDSKKRGLTIEMAGCADVRVMCELEVIPLPVELPAGKHRLVITGRCP